MSTRRHWPALFAAAVLVVVFGGAACGPKSRNVGGEPRAQPAREPRPAIEAQVPALRWIPADAELVLVGASLDALEELAGAVGPLFEGLGLSTAELFASPWLREGIDSKSQVALFSRGTAVTLVAAVSPEARAQPSLLNAAWRTATADGITMAAAHWPASVEPDRGTWLEDIQAAANGQAYSSTTSAASSFSGEGTAIRGHLPILPLLAAAVGGEQFLSCHELLRAAGGISMRAERTGDGVLVELALPIDGPAQERIWSTLSPGPGKGIETLRQSEAAHISSAVDLQSAAEAMRAAQCPELAYELERVTAAMPMNPPPRGVHMVGTRFDPGSLSGSVVVRLALRDKRFLKAQLDQIPGRSFFESTVRVEGQSVKRLSVPTMSSIYYQLTDSRFLFATNKSLAATALTPLSDPVGEQEVLAAGLWPSRLPQLRRLLRLAVPDRGQADLWHDLLLRFEYAGLRVVTGDGSLRLTLTVRPAR